MGKTAREIRPAAAMLAYLVARRDRSHGEDAFFIQEDGSPLTRIALVSWLRVTLSAAGIDPSRFAGHSFRIGAASVAAARGVADSTIQCLGRWKSDSFKCYIRIPRDELTAISITISH